jgi:3-deoxy-D-manno-octulosonate 8-phosphate phosphatase (KDO 8-P phosphatase)
MPPKKIALDRIAMLVMDVDGVLTDGTILLHGDGTESKRFCLLDGHGIKMWHRAGLKVAWISGRASDATRRRAEQLGVSMVFEDATAKLPVFEELLRTEGLDAAQAAYIGDDLLDLPLIRRAGLGVAVVNAVAEVRQHADYVTTRPGGSGAVREVIEHILKGSDRWAPLMERYLL